MSPSAATQREAYGFVGVGHITAAIVEGLSADVPDPPAVFLSPRGRHVGRELASRFENVHVCESNEDVLSNATTIVLAVRPQVAAAVVEELPFRPQHMVISAVAGVKLERLRRWVAPARRITRAIPLPQAACRRSLTVIYPDDAVAQDLFGRVGSFLTPPTEAQLEAFSAATGTFAAHLDYLTTIAGWLVDHGVDERSASAYTANVFGELGRSLSEGGDSLAALTAKHATPGGINEQVMDDLRRDGLRDAVRRALDRTLARLGAGASPQ